MAQYRKRPVVIEAFQWQGDFDALDAWLNALGYSEDGDDGKENGPEGMHESDTEDFVLLIPTLEGEMKAQNGDWIIRGVKGEFYPCKPEIFAATYEALSTFDEPEPCWFPNEGDRQWWREKHALRQAEAAVVRPHLDPLYLLEVLAAARDALAALGKQCGYLPTQQAYSTRMTEPEMQAAKMVADIDTILAASLAAAQASQPSPDLQAQIKELAREFMDDGQGLEDKIIDYLARAAEIGVAAQAYQSTSKCIDCGAPLNIPSGLAAAIVNTVCAPCKQLDEYEQVLAQQHATIEKLERLLASLLAAPRYLPFTHNDEFRGMVKDDTGQWMKVEDLFALAERPQPNFDVELRLRQEWWTGHGCPLAALYGDDGEMQCNALTCMKDFKREPLDDLRKHVEDRRMVKVAEALQAPK